VLAEDAFDQHAQLCAHVLAQRPVDRHVTPHGFHQLPGNLLQCRLAEDFDGAVVGFERVVESKFFFR